MDKESTPPLAPDDWEPPMHQCTFCKGSGREKYQWRVGHVQRYKMLQELRKCSKEVKSDEQGYSYLCEECNGSGKVGRWCTACGKDLHQGIDCITISRYRQDKYYCPEHCPEHIWQSDYDWPNECSRCSITLEGYYRYLLEKNEIDFDKKWLLEDGNIKER